MKAISYDIFNFILLIIITGQYHCHPFISKTLERLPRTTLLTCKKSFVKVRAYNVNTFSNSKKILKK